MQEPLQAVHPARHAPVALARLVLPQARVRQWVHTPPLAIAMEVPDRLASLQRGFPMREPAQRRSQYKRHVERQERQRHPQLRRRAHAQRADTDARRPPATDDNATLLARRATQGMPPEVLLFCLEVSSESLECPHEVVPRIVAAIVPRQPRRCTELHYLVIHMYPFRGILPQLRQTGATIANESMRVKQGACVVGSPLLQESCAPKLIQGCFVNMDRGRGGLHVPEK